MSETKKIAIPMWRGRVSPVMDTAEQLIVIDFKDNIEIARSEVGLSGGEYIRRAAEISEHGVDVLLCGMISRSFEESLESSGVEVVSQLCGNVECVLQAFIDGSIDTGGFDMPGSLNRKRRRRCRGRRCN